MRLRSSAGLITAIAFLVPAPSAYSWGVQGHRIIADVAMDHLSHTARQNIQELLGDSDLASISTWADDIRNDRPETKPWHYVDIPSTADGYQAARDCPGDNCVVARIHLFAQILGDANEPLAARQEALKFLVHFVGDLHQPFHAVADARGGNDVSLSVAGSQQCGDYPCELHGVWDTELIHHAWLSENQYVAKVEAMISRRHMRAGADTPEQWADESLQIAKQAWVEPGVDIDEAYYERELPVLDRQLALAGLRLARMLNAELDQDPKGPWDRSKPATTKRPLHP
jgi:S1/P1 Nuclease